MIFFFLFLYICMDKLKQLLKQNKPTNKVISQKQVLEEQQKRFEEEQKEEKKKEQ